MNFLSELDTFQVRNRLLKSDVIDARRDLRFSDDFEDETDGQRGAYMGLRREYEKSGGELGAPLSFLPWSSSFSSLSSLACM